jgi:hypothetical protein
VPLSLSKGTGGPSCPLTQRALKLSRTLGHSVVKIKPSFKYSRKFLQMQQKRRGQSRSAMTAREDGWQVLEDAGVPKQPSVRCKKGLGEVDSDRPGTRVRMDDGRTDPRPISVSPPGQGHTDAAWQGWTQTQVFVCPEPVSLFPAQPGEETGEGPAVDFEEADRWLPAQKWGDKCPLSSAPTCPEKCSLWLSEMNPHNLCPLTPAVLSHCRKSQDPALPEPSCVTSGPRLPSLGRSPICNQLPRP